MKLKYKETALKKTDVGAGNTDYETEVKVILLI